MNAFLSALAFLIGLSACNRESPLRLAASGSNLSQDHNVLANSLSIYFKRNCVVCHGETGDEGYAPLLSEMSYDSYIHSIREGHPDLHIPSFDASEYPDAATKRDHALITAPRTDF